MLAQVGPLLLANLLRDILLNILIIDVGRLPSKDLGVVHSIRQEGSLQFAAGYIRLDACVSLRGSLHACEIVLRCDTLANHARHLTLIGWLLLFHEGSCPILDFIWNTEDLLFQSLRVWIKSLSLPKVLCASQLLIAI